MRHRGIDLIDGVLDFCAQLRFCGQLFSGAVFRDIAVQFPALQDIRVQGDQHADKWFAIANDHGLETSGCARKISSIGPGETFLPPAVTMRSFLRPVIISLPLSRISPRSPVLYHSPSMASAVASSLFQ